MGTKYDEKIVNEILSGMFEINEVREILDATTPISPSDLIYLIRELVVVAEFVITGPKQGKLRCDSVMICWHSLNAKYQLVNRFDKSVNWTDYFGATNMAAIVIDIVDAPILEFVIGAMVEASVGMMNLFLKFDPTLRDLLNSNE